MNNITFFFASLFRTKDINDNPLFVTEVWRQTTAMSNM